MQSYKDSKLFISLYYSSRTHHYEKRQYNHTGAIYPFRSDDVGPISCPAHGVPFTFRTHSAPVHGQDRDIQQKETCLDIPLYRIRALECAYNILGMQCHHGWRTFRDLRKRIPDVIDIRAVPSKQEEVYRRSAVHLSHGDMDCMGKILL